MGTTFILGPTALLSSTLFGVKHPFQTAGRLEESWVEESSMGYTGIEPYRASVWLCVRVCVFVFSCLCAVTRVSLARHLSFQLAIAERRKKSQCKFVNTFFSQPASSSLISSLDKVAPRFHVLPSFTKGLCVAQEQKGRSFFASPLKIFITHERFLFCFREILFSLTPVF